MGKPRRSQVFYFSFLFFCFLSSLSTSSFALSDAEASYLSQRQLLTLPENGELPDGFEFQVQINLKFDNSRLRRAYIALQAWKKAMYSDPKNITNNWVGPNVCGYSGVFCAQALDDPKINVVAGVDLNHADIAGYLPAELGLMTDLALFHINSNRFCGIIPKSFSELTLMHEFDVSNNRFVGPFPDVTLSWSSVRYIDIRFNNFEGQIPPELFEMKLDALFLNNNRFTSTIPESIGQSTVSVVTFANNKFKGCIPRSIGKMENLDEIIFMNNDLGGCFPPEVGSLKNLTVFDASFNSFVGALPQEFSNLIGVNVLDISHNKLTGVLPENICKLPSLSNFSFSQNYFNGAANACVPTLRKDIVLDDTGNCLGDRPKQKLGNECEAVLSHPIDCSKDKCGGGSSPKPPVKPAPKPQPKPPVHSPPQQ
ncbi:hypothetical protein Golax_004852, partial [Gossypium laxum]|nr:hypothetical protein [Gossypium laxum]